MIREVIDIHVRATSRVFTDRAATVGASEIGQCARKIFFGKRGFDPDPDHADGWGARLRGVIFEDHVFVPALRRYFGNRLLYAGADQTTLASGHLSATPDSLITGLRRDALAHLGVTDIGADCVVAECKTIDPRSALDDAKSEHVFQAQAQLGLLRELTPYRPEWAIVSYANASFLDDIVEFPIRFDPRIFEVAKARADTIMTANAPEELKPEGYIAGGAECEYCPFARTCGRLRRAVPDGDAEAPDPQFVAEVADLARVAKERRQEVEAATSALREVEHELRERLRAKGLRRVAGDGVQVTWSAVKGRPAFDTKAIREAAERAGIDLSQFETAGDPTDRLAISIRASAPAAA
jgi:hypothetical protein